MSDIRTTLYKSAFVDLDRVERSYSNTSEIDAHYEFVDKHYKTQEISLEHKVQILTQIVGELLYVNSFPKL